MTYDFCSNSKPLFNEKPVLFPFFDIVGLQVRTSNLNGQSGKDLKLLWEEFITEKYWEQINPNSKEFYLVYTDYESDFTGNYTAIIGCKVESTLQNTIPQKTILRHFEEAKMLEFNVCGTLPDSVVKCWEEIWKENIKRAYYLDIEVYKIDEILKKKTEINTKIFLSI
ncbi:MAG: GyrI-like domain-containing protein [Bacteroidales bacterium]